MENKKWDLGSIKKGLDRFLSESGRLPTVIEVESLDYLPNRKYIERNFGGMQKIRELLGYRDIHLGKGKFRTEIALRVNNRGRDAELELQALLQEKFGEVFVHTEKIFDNSKNRIDFYVYSPSGNFGIDVFTTDTMHNLQGNINIKADNHTGQTVTVSVYELTITRKGDL